MFTSSFAVAAAFASLLAGRAVALVQTGGSCTMNGALAQCMGYDASKGCTYSAYDACASKSSLSAQASCYCDFFQLQADCWGQGKCCTEWPAHAAVATDICNYAKGCNVKAATLKTKVAAGWAVVMQTCNNDCGTDIPCVSSEPEPKNGQDPNGNCQPRSYWDNGTCSRHMCASYDKHKRDGVLGANHSHHVRRQLLAKRNGHL